MLDEADVVEINRKPFLFESMNKEDIRGRLEAMSADNMYVIFHSMSHKELKEANPDAFQTEKWYSKAFTTEVLTADQIQQLNALEKSEEQTMGYPPENTFIPKSLEPL